MCRVFQALLILISHYCISLWIDTNEEYHSVFCPDTGQLFHCLNTICKELLICTKQDKTISNNNHIQITILCPITWHRVRCIFPEWFVIIVKANAISISTIPFFIHNWYIENTPMREMNNLISDGITAHSNIITSINILRNMVNQFHRIVDSTYRWHKEPTKLLNCLRKYELQLFQLWL